jgi:hypothetical protein
MQYLWMKPHDIKSADVSCSKRDLVPHLPHDRLWLNAWSEFFRDVADVPFRQCFYQKVHSWMYIAITSLMSSQHQILVWGISKNEVICIRMDPCQYYRWYHLLHASAHPVPCVMKRVYSAVMTEKRGKVLKIMLVGGVQVFLLHIRPCTSRRLRSWDPWGKKASIPSNSGSTLGRKCICILLWLREALQLRQCA